MRITTVVAVVALVSCPCWAHNEGFKIGVSTDRRVYQLGETVEGAATVTNATAEELYLKLSGNFCSSYSVWIEDSDGEVVARDHRTCLFVYTDGAEVGPFGSWPMEINRWPQNVGDFGANHPPPYPEHVAPGTYRLVVDFHEREPISSAPFVICDGACPEPRSLVIPAAGNNPGANGTLWSTDLGFQGLGGGDSIVRLTMVEHGSGGSQVGPVELIVQDLEAIHIPNALDALFNHQGQAAIFLEIRGGDLSVSSRIVNTAETGTFAQLVPPVSADSGRPAILVPGLRHSGEIWRTNLGVVNLQPVEVDVDLVLNTGTGTAVPLGPITLGPGEYRQLNDIFSGVVDPQQELMTASVWVVGSRPELGASLLAYGSVIDNRTGDAVFVPGVPAHIEENIY